MRKAIEIGLVVAGLAYAIVLPAMALDKKDEKSRVNLYPIPRTPMRYVIRVPQAPKAPPQAPVTDQLIQPQKKNAPK